MEHRTGAANFYPVTFLRKQHEYADVYSYFFSAEGIQYEAGQYVHVKLGDSPDRSLVHEFSFASCPSEEQLQFTMHVGSQTAFKQRIDTLQPGDVISLFKIRGNIALPADTNRPLVFIAGGVGMAPFRSMLLTAARTHGYSTTLLQVQRGDYLFEGTLSDVVDNYIKSSPELFSENLKRVVAATPDARYFVCGSDRFIAATLEYLTQESVPAQDVALEYFTKRHRGRQI